MHDRPIYSGQESVSRRSANMTLDKLDEALSNLERRMGIHSAARETIQPLPRDEDIAAIRARQEALARRDDRPLYRPEPAPAAAYAPAYAPAFDPSALRAELAGLRDDLNREMASTIAAQFSGIRDDLRSLDRPGGGVTQADLADGFARMTRELGLVASRVENTDAGALRAEVEELKSHVAALAREDTLRDMADRWTVIEREIGALPRTLGSREDLNAILDRIADLGGVLSGMPDSGSIQAMEQQMRALAEAVEALAGQNAAVSPGHLHAIEGRLDEITRAILSVSSSPQAEIDTTPFDRIEARLATLARQVEERSGGAGDESVERRLGEIAARLDALHESTAANGAQSQAMETVAERLDELARRIDAETRGAPALPADMMQGIEARFEDIARRLDTQHRSVEEAGRHMLQSLDQRLEELAGRIDGTDREPADMPTFDHMERRIEEIAQMLSSGDGLSLGGQAQPDKRALEGLEAQIEALSQKLSSISVPAADFGALDDLAPRLTAISDQLTSGREDMIAAAREAAEQVVSKFSNGASDEQKQMLGQLAGDLRALEGLARNSDDRNSRTFEAIHDTLVKVADRIAGLEASLQPGEPPVAAPLKPAARPMPSPQAAAAPMAHVDDAPPVDFAASDEPFLPERPGRIVRAGLAPAEAAVMAARAALEDADKADPEAETSVEAPEPARQKKGFLSGLRGAVRRGGADDAAVSAAAAGPRAPMPFETPEPKAGAASLADEPIEPGSGGADLAEIMRRVRAARAEPAQAGVVAEPADDAGKSDFIAAARRAARAAAAEVSPVEKIASKVEGAQTGLGGILAARRRPLMVAAAAILLALLAFPLGRGYLMDRGGTPAEMAQIEDAAAPAASDADAAAPEATEPASPAEADGADAGVEGEVDAGAMPAVNAMRVVDAPMPTLPTPEGAVTASASAMTSQTAVNAMPMQPSPETAIPTPSIETFKANPGLGMVAMTDIPDEIGPIALREAAAAGDAKALFVIGDRLMGGGPSDPDGDMAEAAKWYEMAAERGYGPAQYRIGNAYEKGLGVERDVEAARGWYLRAAEQGNVSAMHNLAVLYATEIDGARNMSEAARWFMEAAERGVKDSQVNLGILSARGEGVPQDLAESWKWLALAAQAGDADAAAKRDEVAGYMRPDQLETARAAVDLWKVRPVEVAANAIDVPEAWTTGPEMTAAAPMSSEDMKKAVRNIQAILNNNGYDAGPADGVMGARTREAIIAFQEDNGLVPNGEVDRALVDKLLELNGQS